MNRTTTLLITLIMAALPFTTVFALSHTAEPAPSNPGALSFTERAGHHAVTHFDLSDSDGPPTAVFAAEDSHGDVVMLAYVSQNRLKVTDGSFQTEDILQMETSLGTAGHRLDVVFEGETYTISLDQRETVTARAMAPATAAAPVADPRPLLDGNDQEVAWSHTRTDWGDGSMETTFTTPLAQGAWHPHVTGGAVTVREGWTAHESMGLLDVDTALEGVAYVSTSLGDLPGRYGAEASVRAVSPHTFTGATVLAGVSGDPDDPTVHWAVVAERAPPDADEAVGWAFYYHASGEDPLQVSPAVGLGWHTVQAIVDEATETLILRVDEGEAFTFHHGGLALATHLAVGDLQHEVDSMSGFGSAHYDDVAVYPLEGPPETMFGNHIVTRFSLGGNAARTTGVLALEDPDGNPVMHAKVSEGYVYVTDGVDSDGDPIYVRIPRGIGGAFHRLDVVPHGPTYTVELDGTYTVTAASFHPTTQATPLADPHAVLGLPWDDGPLQWDRTRVDDSAMAHDTTFARPLLDAGFTAYQEGDEGRIQVRDDRQGYQSPGVLQIRRLPTEALAYISAERPVGTGVYHAEASFTPLDDFAVPAGMALVSGLTGPVEDPTVLWSVVVEKTDLDEWALAYRAPDGTQTRVSPPAGFTWRSVHVVVDETRHTLALDVDGGPVWRFSGQDLGTAERIGIGDVFPDPLHEAATLSPLGVARFDDVAIYEQEAP